MPPKGMFVAGSLAMGTGVAPLLTIGKHLDVTKQAVGQLIDTLVLRGYLKREADDEDRRRISIKLTERGWFVVVVLCLVCVLIDAELAARVGADTVAAARSVLGALVELGGEPVPGL